jgi:hypothetical protein
MKFSHEQHKKALKLLGKTDKDWDKFLSHRRVRENIEFHQRCAQCDEGKNTMELKPPNTIDCPIPEASFECPKCIQTYGDQKPIDVWTREQYHSFVRNEWKTHFYQTV